MKNHVVHKHGPEDHHPPNNLEKKTTRKFTLTGNLQLPRKHAKAIFLETSTNKYSLEADLLRRRFPPRAVKRVQFLEGGLGPDTEAPDVATRGYLQQVKMGNVNERDARDVTEGASDAVVLVIDDEGPTALDATTIPHLTLAGTESTRVFHLQTHHRH